MSDTLPETPDSPLRQPSPVPSPTDLADRKKLRRSSRLFPEEMSMVFNPSNKSSKDSAQQPTAASTGYNGCEDRESSPSPSPSHRTVSFPASDFPTLPAVTSVGERARSSSAALAGYALTPIPLRATLGRAFISRKPNSEASLSPSPILASPPVQPATCESSHGDRFSLSPSRPCASPTPPPLQGSHAPTIDDVLENDALFAGFEKFLGARQAAEGLVFLREVGQFATSEASRRTELARRIAEKFVVAGAEREVNLSGATRQFIEEQLNLADDGGEWSSATIFDQAKREVCLDLGTSLLAEWAATVAPSEAATTTTTVASGSALDP